jgi:transmembrane sensor
MLAQGYALSYSPDEIIPASAVDAAVSAAWLRGLLVFRDTRLDDVISEINRYRKGRIVLVDRGAASQRVFATFRIDRLDDVFETIEKAFQLKVTILPAGLVLVG